MKIPAHIIDMVHQSMGLSGNPGSHRVVCAMSGGVDSSVAAALLKHAGYDVVGITLQLYDHGEAIRRKGACCAGQDIHDARRVAAALDIPHYVLDFESRFREAVIDDFVESYIQGATPIPCVKCNQTVKFADLLWRAKELGGSALATGHYVDSVAAGQGRQLRTPADMARDQSYFLFATTQEQVNYLRFPLARLTKAETRAVATDLGLMVADKPDSQDICFVPDGNYSGFIDRYLEHENRENEIPDKGEIVNQQGKVLGEHTGIHRYTIGQRRGLGIAHEKPLYVVKIERLKNQIIVGEKEELGSLEFIAKGVNWVKFDEPNEPVRALVKVRYRHEPAPATIHALPDAHARIVFDEPQDAITPGQATVFYDVETGEEVVGGKSQEEDWQDITRYSDGPCVVIPVGVLPGQRGAFTGF